MRNPGLKSETWATHHSELRFSGLMPLQTLGFGPGEVVPAGLPGSFDPQEIVRWESGSSSADVFFRLAQHFFLDLHVSILV